MAIEYYDVSANDVGKYADTFIEYIEQVFMPAADKLGIPRENIVYKKNREESAETQSEEAAKTEEPNAQDVVANNNEQFKTDTEDDHNSVMFDSLKRALNVGYEFLKESQRMREANDDNIPVTITVDGNTHILRFQPAVDDAFNDVELKDKFKLKTVDGQGEGGEWYDKINAVLNPESKETNGSITVNELRQIAPKIKEEVERILNSTDSENATSQIHSLFGSNAKAEVVIGKQLGAIKESVNSHIVKFREAVISIDEPKDKENQPAIFQIKIKITGADDSVVQDNDKLESLIKNTLIPQLNSKISNFMDKLTSGLKNFFKEESTAYKISVLDDEDSIKIDSPTEASIVIRVDKKTSKSGMSVINDLANNPALGIKAKGI